jgi:hypothetical protein
MSDRKGKIFLDFQTFFFGSNNIEEFQMLTHEDIGLIVKNCLIDENQIKI